MVHSHLTCFEQVLQPILDALDSPGRNPCLTGVQISSLAFALTLLARSRVGSPPTLPTSSHKEKGPRDSQKRFLEKSWFIVTASDEEAERLHDDLYFFHSMLGLPTETLAFFPQWGCLPSEPVPPSIDRVAQRVRTLHRLTEGKPTMVITSVQAAIQRLIPLAIFGEACLSLKVGAVIEREPFIAHLLRLGYRLVSVVEIPGEFSVKGGILDIFSTAYADPVRVEFLGDTIESTRLFNPATQESTEQRDQVWVLPAREYLPVVEDPRIPPLPVPPEAEWRSPDVYANMATLVEYFSDVPIVALENPTNLAKQAGDFWAELLETWDRRLAHSGQSLYPDPDRLYLLWDEMLQQLQKGPILATDAMVPPEGLWHPVVPFPVQSPQSIGLGLRGTPFSQTLKTLEGLRSRGLVAVIARSRGQVDRLLALFAEHEHPATSWNPRDWTSPAAQRPPFYLLHGDLSAGFVSHEGQVAVITEEELFAKGVRHRPHAKTQTATFLSSLEDVNVGDHVVHVLHGISQYRGLRRLSVQGFESDYLVLQFAGRDTLYVPLDRLNQIQRYRGADTHVPKLDRLGGTSWARTTARVRKGIEEMAQELVELYARREVVQRKVYGDDATLTHEFEAGFEYEETPDQLRSIEEIQRDMESPKPMDRLVCGDVGYGKTEVAMRAAFKAVQDNRQIAVLVPTTLLAQQHYEIFSRRFAPFPVRVAALSRFQSPKEIKETVKELASGTVDIAIGTHRLLQKDVEFKNLGLVIIDEEQWFGVRHKERLKQLRTQVDVLTLTATPIPRTLQMAFSGVRDLSVIDTPPAGRLAIRTQVLRFDATVIREAIRRELARGGQAFFVHNRVQTMERMGTWLQDLVPEARVVMAHGQMDERVLESVMLKFFHGEADVLVASAIIQSGLDVPRANTIIVDRADTFGLAQLYQLRGRVGRSGHQAYAYFLFSNEEVLSTEAQKRLLAIQEFADLGSGFRIAAADLEIRGAGNLLGKQQSGNIAAVGLDLYLQMVEQAVQQLKGQEIEPESDPTLHLNVSAYIPEEYVEDGHQRLSLYKRLSASQQVGDLALLHGEVQDRYGPIPEPVERLFEVMQIKLLAKFLRLESVEATSKKIGMAFEPHVQIPNAAIEWLFDHYDGHIQLRSPRSFEILSPHTEWTGLATELTIILQRLKEYVTKKTLVQSANVDE